MQISKCLTIALLAGLLGACVDGEPDETRTTPSTEEQAPEGVSVYWDETALSPEEIERGRLDPSWRRVVELDFVAWEDSVPNPEHWEDISYESLSEKLAEMFQPGSCTGGGRVRQG
jgi:hypothetical protein